MAHRSKRLLALSVFVVIASVLIWNFSEVKTEARWLLSSRGCSEFCVALRSNEVFSGRRGADRERSRFDLAFLREAASFRLARRPYREFR